MKKEKTTKTYNEEQEFDFTVAWGEIYFADLGDIKNHEPGELSGERPVIITQNNYGNKFSPTVTIIPVTSSLKRRDLPTHLFLKKGTGGIFKDSIAQAEQIQTISKSKLKFYIGKLGLDEMKDLHTCLEIQTGMEYIMDIEGGVTVED